MPIAKSPGIYILLIINYTNQLLYSGTYKGINSLGYLREFFEKNSDFFII